MRFPKPFGTAASLFRADHAENQRQKKAGSPEKIHRKTAKSAGDEL